MKDSFHLPKFIRAYKLMSNWARGCDFDEKWKHWGAGPICRDHATLLRRNKDQLRDNMTTTPARLAGISANRARNFPAGPAWWTKPATGVIGWLETHSVYAYCFHMVASGWLVSPSRILSFILSAFFKRHISHGIYHTLDWNNRNRRNTFNNLADVE